MKLAEALIIRRELMRKVASLKSRIAQNAAVQEGDTPSEDPEGLMAEAQSTLVELETLICKINRTNVRTTLPNTMTMMEALAQRECLIKKHAVLDNTLDTAKVRQHRYSREEIKWVKLLNVKTIQKQADDISGQIRKLNTVIQEANWLTELAE